MPIRCSAGWHSRRTREQPPEQNTIKEGRSCEFRDVAGRQGALRRGGQLDDGATRHPGRGGGRPTPAFEEVGDAEGARGRRAAHLPQFRQKPARKQRRGLR